MSTVPSRRLARRSRRGSACRRSSAPGHIRAVAAKLREHKTRLARRISLEQGKILPLAEVEIDFTANYMDYMAEWARRIEGEILGSDRPGETIYLHRRLIGVVAGILP